MIIIKGGDAFAYLADKLPRDKYEAMLNELESELLNISEKYGLTKDILESFNENKVLEIYRDDDK